MYKYLLKMPIASNNVYLFLPDKPAEDNIQIALLLLLQRKTNSKFTQTMKNSEEIKS